MKSSAKGADLYGGKGERCSDFDWVQVEIVSIAENR